MQNASAFARPLSALPSNRTILYGIGSLRLGGASCKRSEGQLRFLPSNRSFARTALTRPQGGAQLLELALLSQCPKSCQLPFQSSPAQLVPASWECGQALPNPELARGLEFFTLLGLLMDSFCFVLFCFFFCLSPDTCTRSLRGQSGSPLRLTPL